MANLNFRVFRRNGKNLILLWSSSQLSEGQKDCISAYEVSDDLPGRDLVFSSFVPDNPEKFATDVTGIVISHAQNGIDPAEPTTVRVVLGSGDDSIEMVKDVLPANSVSEQVHPAKPSVDKDGGRICHLYAFDTENDKWVPWPAEGKIPDNVKINITG